MAWQYVVANVTAYDNDLNLLYLIEKLAFLSALLVAWIKSKGRWKILYANLFGASLVYAVSSYLANWALSRDGYYSGSLYDIFLAVSMAWITGIGLWLPGDEPQPDARSTSPSHGIWLARLGMIAVFSLPLFAAWALLEPGIPPRIRSFRLMLTLGAALVMGIMVFARQRLLDHELRRLLKQSRESFANLKRLQAQITESEKLASIGQLVGGAAHELNNPIARHAWVLRSADEYFPQPRPAGTGGENRSACSPHQFLSGQPAQLRQAGSGGNGSRISQDGTANRRQTLGDDLPGSQNRSGH